MEIILKLINRYFVATSFPEQVPHNGLCYFVNPFNIVEPPFHYESKQLFPLNSCEFSH